MKSVFFLQLVCQTLMNSVYCTVDYNKLETVRDAIAQHIYYSVCFFFRFFFLRVFYFYLLTKRLQANFQMKLYGDRIRAKEQFEWLW